jgi:hypothetical protein
LQRNRNVKAGKMLDAWKSNVGPPKKSAVSGTPNAAAGIIFESRDGLRLPIPARKSRIVGVKTGGR